MGHIEAVQRLADNRLQELCQVKDDKIRMTQEIDYLRMQLSYLPDERIIETPLFQRLQDNCNYYRDDVERQRASVESAQTEIEELRTNRRQYMEQVQTEERKRREVLESELRRLENDLTRVRGNRDHLQQQLELRCSKDNTELVQHQEIRVIANTRKDQITTLTTEIQRLKMKIAADAGDREAFDYYSVNEELSLVDQLRKQVKTMEEQVKTLQDENSTLKAVEAVSNEETRSELEKALSTQTQLQNELKEANDRVKVIDQRFGTLAKADDPLRQLVEQLEAQTKLVKDLELKCEFYQKTESQLMSEIENISKEWFQLEEKSSRKILDIATKEDQIVQLLAEKTKYDQKYGMLHKQKDSLSNVNIALRRQSEKQLEQIRRLEEHEKNLDQQLVSRNNLINMYVCMYVCMLNLSI
ncbi:hypothetical protein BDF19DRAFT_21918 [Syncephalis fuscata]|nr:hypothetical protein BDF19DRAFT_21918 [Syncephalis fuscata]